MTVTGAIVLGVIIALAMSLLVYYARTGAPPVPAKTSEIRDVVALLDEVAPSGRVYELGCGWGALALALARARPDDSVIGIELSPLPCLVAWLRARRVPNLTVRWADFRRVPVNDAAAVTAYLMIKPMLALADKLDEELAPGTPVVALTFAFRDRAPARELRGAGVRGVASLYRWPARRV